MGTRSISRLALGVGAIVVLLLSGGASEARQAGRTGSSEAPARARANVDFVGYWVSVVTEDWRFRMVTPPKRDYTSVPLNPEGKRVADTWDWQKDQAAGLQCKAFGAANIMRVPGRLHVTWEGDETLRIDTDAGQQVRRLQFRPTSAASRARTWQGFSVAEWERTDIPATGLAILTVPAPPPNYSMKVVTNGLRSGYLRTNGVPYSEDTVVTEFFDLIGQPNGVEWLVITTVVDDPKYLLQPFITTTHFKRESDGSKWHPRPCEIVPPTRGPLPAFPQRFVEQ